jgi:hypothetical protein
MANAYGMMGGNAKVGRMISILAGASEQNRQSIYQRQQKEIWRYINRRENALKERDRWFKDMGNKELGEHLSREYKAFGTADRGEIQGQIDAAKKMLADYQQAAKPLLSPVKPVIDTSGAEQSITSLIKELKDTHEQHEIVKGSLNDLNNQIKELRDAQANVTNVTEWQKFQDKIDAVKNRIKELKGELGLEALRGMKGVSVSDGVQLPTRESILKKGDAAIKNFKVQDKPTKQEVKLTDIMNQMNGGISSMVSGLEQLGIELPQGMKDVLGGIQSVTSILTGISTILTAIEAISTADTIIPFASGGVVKAAGGYRVPGRTFSGDLVPARLNAGELVLNQAQAGVIANALQDREFGSGASLQPYVEGEHIFLGMENTLKRKGKGEIVTTSTLRRLGLI